MQMTDDAPKQESLGRKRKWHVGDVVTLRCSVDDLPTMVINKVTDMHMVGSVGGNKNNSTNSNESTMFTGVEVVFINKNQSPTTLVVDANTLRLLAAYDEDFPSSKFTNDHAADNNSQTNNDATSAPSNDKTATQPSAINSDTKSGTGTSQPADIAPTPSDKTSKPKK